LIKFEAVIDILVIVIQNLLIVFKIIVVDATDILILKCYAYFILSEHFRGKVRKTIEKPGKKYNIP